MNELQDALKRWDSKRSEHVINRIRSESDDVALFVEAVRRVANLDMEAATDIINRLRYIETGDEWDDKIDDIAAEAVNTALGITTKDDE